MQQQIKCISDVYKSLRQISLKYNNSPSLSLSLQLEHLHQILIAASTLRPQQECHASDPHSSRSIAFHNLSPNHTTSSKCNGLKRHALVKFVTDKEETDLTPTLFSSTFHLLPLWKSHLSELGHVFLALLFVFLALLFLYLPLVASVIYTRSIHTEGRSNAMSCIQPPAR